MRIDKGVVEQGVKFINLEILTKYVKPAPGASLMRFCIIKIIIICNGVKYILLLFNNMRLDA